MDSLLASYLSSDEEEEEHPHKEIPQPSHTFSSLSLPQPKSSFTSLSLPPPKSSTPAITSLPQPKSTQSKPSSIFPSLPQPKFSSPFSSLPPPTSSSSSSIFSSLPPPTLDNPQTPLNPTSSFDSKPKRVVQFRSPIILKPPTDEDDDDEEQEKQRKPIKQPVSSGSSLNSFFSSLPAPKNTLGSGSAPLLGAGRRSVVETDVATVNRDELESEGAQESYAGNFNDESTPVSTAEEPISTGSDSSSWNAGNENYGSYGYYEDNGNYGGYEGNYGNYDGGSAIASTTYMPESSGLIETMPKMPGKRGRKEIPSDIVEVKQDELMKNRPREDQVKLTGIAFGPSYQPASAKGKPSKLHKRKHQIGSLYYDMRQKEHELAERRSKGFLTKAETQAKYGW